MATQPTSDGTETLFGVMVGVYFKVNQAAHCIRKLQSEDFDGKVFKGEDGYYRILVSTYTNITEAQDMEAKLKSLKFKSYITVNLGEQVPEEEVNAVMPPPKVNPKKLDKVRIKEGAVRYGTNVQFPDWVYEVEMFVRYIDGDCVTISTVAAGPTLGNVHRKYIEKIKAET